MNRPRCWVKRLEPQDADRKEGWAVGSVVEVLFDSRPSDIREGHLLFCVRPTDGRVISVGRSLHHGDEALHDKTVEGRARWLFRVPIAILAVSDTSDDGLDVSEFGGLTSSYRSLTARQTAIATGRFGL
jgi:hypothetical protein